MNRRNFLKQVLATAAVGAAAPAAMARTPLRPGRYVLETPGLGDELAGASRVVVGGKRYEIALNVVDGQVCGWKWIEAKR